MAAVTILAFDPDRRTNAQAIVDCVTLGYLSADVLTIDVTYNAGKFWRDWRPDVLVTSDLEQHFDTDHHWDFRKMLAPDGLHERVVFDPPYGYRGTSAHPLDGQYGLGEYLSVAERDALMSDGFTECVRVLAPDGFLLFKCQDQVVSGKKRWQTIMFAELGARLGLRLVDELHVNGYRPQPGNRGQKHSASNLSTLQIYRKAKS